MARPLVEVDGGPRLRSTLRKAGSDLEDLKAANARAAAIAADAGRRLAPRGATGRLVGSIRSSGTKTGGYVRAGYARIPYAGVQEWGYRSGRPIAGRYFLTTGAKQTEPIWLGLYYRDVIKALQKVEGK